MVDVIDQKSSFRGKFLSLFKLHLPEAELLENAFYMSENLNTENNLLVPSTRRNLFKGVATGLVAGSVAGPAILSGAKKGKKAGVRKGRINQSVVSWCFADHWSVEETCQQAKRLGCRVWN